MDYTLHKCSNSYSFSEIYSFFYKRACLFVCSYTHDSFVAEDIASESLIKLWEILKETHEGNIEPLLFTLLRNKSIDWLRHEKKKREALNLMSDWKIQDFNIRINALQKYDCTEIFVHEIQELIQKALDEMPVQRRKVWELSRIKGMPNKEIAEYLHISVKGVEYHKTQCLKQLRQVLKDYLPLLIFFF